MKKYQLKAAAYHLQLNEIKKILYNTTTFRDRCLLKSLFWTGLRREEAANLDVRDIGVFCPTLQKGIFQELSYKF